MAKWVRSLNFRALNRAGPRDGVAGGGAQEAEVLNRAAKAAKGGGGEYERGIKPPSHKGSRIL